MRQLPRIMAVTGIFVLIIHFAITLLYVCSTSYWSQISRPVTEKYMEPAFYQGWSLFAPDVAHWDCKVDYRIMRNNTWGSWNYTGELPNQSHPKIEEMSIKVGHYMGFLLHDNLYEENGVMRFDRCEANGYYRMAYYMAIAHQNKLNPSPWDSLQIRARMIFPAALGTKAEPEFKNYDFPARGATQAAP